MRSVPLPITGLLPCIATIVLCLGLASPLSLTHKAVAATLLAGLGGLSLFPAERRVVPQLGQPSAMMLLPCICWFAVGFVLPKLLAIGVHALDGLPGALLQLPALNTISMLQR